MRELEAAAAIRSDVDTGIRRHDQIILRPFDASANVSNVSYI
ncbi:unannotated protein [freshwater metagenome]|uniref:Unannotated protein n=1 Tax=freshwater metagenome TaxID=449393 RepID=A0A6J7PJ69_9ZZZZ